MSLNCSITLPIGVDPEMSKCVKVAYPYFNFTFDLLHFLTIFLFVTFIHL